MSPVPSSDSRRSPGSGKTITGKKRIGRMLVEAGIITSGQLQEALAAQGKAGGKTVQSLIDLGHMNRLQFLHFMAKQPGIPSVSLKNCEISDEVVNLVPEAFVRRHEIFPIDRLGKLLTVGMVCPLDSQTVQELEAITGLRVKSMLCTRQEIEDAIFRYHGERSKRVERRASARR